MQADRWSIFLDTFFKAAVIEKYLPSIAQGVLVTLQIAVLVVVSGIVLGLVLALIRAYRIRAVNILIVMLVDIFRALPPLVLILVIYFGLPNVGVSLPNFVVLWLVLSLVLAAFSEEIFRAGIMAVPKGQWEAARSTGLGFGNAVVRGDPPGDPAHDSAADQPHHRHHQKYGARHGGRRA